MEDINMFIDLETERLFLKCIVYNDMDNSLIE